MPCATSTWQNVDVSAVQNASVQPCRDAQCVTLPSKRVPLLQLPLRTTIHSAADRANEAAQPRQPAQRRTLCPQHARRAGGSCVRQTACELARQGRARFARAPHGRLSDGLSVRRPGHVRPRTRRRRSRPSLCARAFTRYNYNMQHLSSRAFLHAARHVAHEVPASLSRSLVCC